MQVLATNLHKLVYQNTLDLGQYNLLRNDLVCWLSLVKIENQKTHVTENQILELLNTIPEIRIITNLILPNWIICSAHDADFGLYGLLGNTKLWDLPFSRQKYNWIDARGITVYHSKVKPKLLNILVELCQRCDYVIYYPHSFTTITDFWQWLKSCTGLTDENRSQIIFMKPNETKSYQTYSAGIIPLDIALKQKEFYQVNKSNKDIILGSPALRNKIITEKSITQPQREFEYTEPNQQPIIQEINKLYIQLLAYHLANPDQLAIETGAILGKINEIREYLGISQ